jgi:hypothetical protein
MEPPKTKRKSTTEKLKEVVKAKQNGLETLTCIHGHTWTRVPVRGRKPTTCPGHRSKGSETAPKPRRAESSSETTNPLAKANEARRKAKDAIMQRRVDEVLDNPNIDLDLKLKLAYAQKRLTGEIPSNEPDMMMIQVRTEMLKQAFRMITS